MRSKQLRVDGGGAESSSMLPTDYFFPSFRTASAGDDVKSWTTQRPNNCRMTFVFGIGTFAPIELVSYFSPFRLELWLMFLRPTFVSPGFLLLVSLSGRFSPL